jgi:hypothetical protein
MSNAINQASQREAFMLPPLLRRASLALEGLAQLRVALLGRLALLGRAGRDMEESRTVESEEESEEVDSVEVDSEEAAEPSE